MRATGPAQRDRREDAMRSELEAVQRADQGSLERFCAEVQERFPGHPVALASPPSRSVRIGLGSELGPVVSCELPAWGLHVRLDWGGSEAAGAVRQSLPIVIEYPFRLGAGGSSCIVEVRYSWASLPGDHRLLNDLQALVMLGELLLDSA